MIEPIYRRLGKRIRLLREGRLSQKRLGELCNYTRTSVTNIESGRQRVMLHDLPLIAKALEVSVSYLLFGVLK